MRRRSGWAGVCGLLAGVCSRGSKSSLCWSLRGMDAWRKGGRKEGMGVHCMVGVEVDGEEGMEVLEVMLEVVEVRCWW